MSDKKNILSAGVPMSDELAKIYYDIWEYGQDHEPEEKYSFDNGVQIEEMAVVLAEKKRLILKFEKLNKDFIKLIEEAYKG